MSELYYSLDQSFYKVIINSKEKIDFKLYEIHAYNKQTNVLCGIGNYEPRERAFIVGVQLKDYQTNDTEDYVIGNVTASDSERIPNFILVHKKTKEKIELHQPNGSVAYAENFSFNQSELSILTEPDEMVPVKPTKPLYKPEKSVSDSIIDTIPSRFVPKKFKINGE